MSKTGEKVVQCIHPSCLYLWQCTSPAFLLLWPTVTVLFIFGATWQASGQKCKVVACGMKLKMALLSISHFKLQNLSKVFYFSKSPTATLLWALTGLIIFELIGFIQIQYISKQIYCFLFR